MVQENSVKRVKVVAIVGPTASGKSGTAVKLAKSINGEIISADSMQIYKHMNIGTAKVTLDEMKGIPHYLIDIVEPTENYSVSDWVRMAREKIADIAKRGKTPIIVGGTGLYVTSLLKGYSFHNTGENKTLRDKYHSIYTKQGIEPLMERLRELSPEKAETIDPTKVKYVIRTLEVLESENGSEDKNTGEEYDYLLLGLDVPREELYSRINSRVDEMMDAGLIQEFDELVTIHNLKRENQSSGAIGYRELFQYKNGELSIEEAVNLIKQHSRNYAKRQMTWFRKMDNMLWVSPVDYNKIEQLAKTFIGER